MYLSRVEIDVNNRQKVKDLTHLGAYHNWVERSFPQEFDEHTRSRKLWRIDTVNHKDYLMVVSPEKPTPDKLERYGIAGSTRTIDYNRVLDSINTGTKARFKVILHPTYSKMQPGEQRGKLMQCLSYESQIDYLINRSHKNGFRLDESNFTITNKSIGILKKSHHKHIYLRKVCYEGYLTVEDVDKFKNVLCNGLGKKKAYGCGLMTIAPI